MKLDVTYDKKTGYLLPYVDEFDNPDRKPKLPNELHVSPQEFSLIKDWALLHESEFLGNMYDRWPWLKELPQGQEVKVIVDF